MKVTVVGAGFTGKMTAHRVLEKGLADVALVDIVEGLPQGLALDMMEAAPVEGFTTRIEGSNGYEIADGSDVVVITAGVARKPGMSRADLIDINTKIVGSVGKEVAQRCPGAVVVVLSNPLDEMTYIAGEATGFPRQRVIGQAGVLDSARFRYFIAEACGCLPSEVEATTLGSHGEIMVPLPRLATAKGKPITDIIDADTIAKLCERTRDGGAEIVGLLKTGSAYFAPSTAVVAMVRAILTDSKETFPVCAWLTGQYGLSDMFLGVPAKLGRTGIIEIEEWELTTEELDELHAAAKIVQERIAGLSV